MVSCCQLNQVEEKRVTQYMTDLLWQQNTQAGPYNFDGKQLFHPSINQSLPIKSFSGLH